MENIQQKKRYRRRCRNCRVRVSLFLFKREGKLFCSCPKCGASGRFFKKRNI